MCPVRLLHGEPVSICLEAPLEHELGLIFFLGDGSDDVFVQSGRYRVGLDVGDEPGFVFPFNQSINVVFCG